MGARLGDLVAIGFSGTMGVIVGRTSLGWIVELDDDSYVVTIFARRRLVAASSHISTAQRW